MPTPRYETKLLVRRHHRLKFNCLYTNTTVKTRMHSSVMRAARLLTISRSIQGWVSALWGVCPVGCLPRGCHVTPPWTDFLTHACENITFLPATTVASGNILFTHKHFCLKLNYLHTNTRDLNYNVYMQITRHEICTVQAKTVKCEVVLLTQEQEIAKVLSINKNQSQTILFTYKNYRL